MRREIITYPNPILLKVSDPVSTEKIDDEMRELLDDMVETMYADDGIGLAAPQVGINLRAIVVDIRQDSSNLFKMINPEIISMEGEEEMEEGCLSVPGLQVSIKRAMKVTVRYLDEMGKEQEIDAEELLAVAFQHEIDHLNGHLIIDNVSRLKRDLYTRKVKKSRGEK
jgi:peptide deformylase